VIVPRMTTLLRLVAAAELRHLRPALVPGLLHDRRDLRVGGEALPAVEIPVEDHPHPVVLIGVAEHERALRAVLLALLGTLGGEDPSERSNSSTVVVASSILVLLTFPASPSDAEAGVSMRRGRSRHMGQLPYVAIGHPTLPGSARADQTRRNDVVMVSLNLSRPVSVPFAKFRDSHSQVQDFKIRLTDLICTSPMLIAFGSDTHRLAFEHLPRSRHSRLGSGRWPSPAPCAMVPPCTG